METSSSEIFRSIHVLMKSLDEEKKSVKNVSQLFNENIIEKRSKLIRECENLLFSDFQTTGKKSREILWRKGYYEFIAFAKKYWHREQNGTKPKYLAKLRELLLEGIAAYKRIAIKMELVYDLDLTFFIDFTIINDQNFDISPPMCDYKFDKSLEAASYALETIHSAFLSLGDLHRYFIEFNFERNPKISRDLAAKFYHEAFKLNPTIGMAQNQLGTLFHGMNMDLDSIYHYLYSLTCTVPFDFSENNVSKLFLAHTEYLENLDPEKMEFNLRDFYARFFLVSDIYFFDKDVPEFTNLCHCVLVDLRKVLCSKTISISEGSLFKLVCILLFCMSKLKMIKSPKVYSLTAFLVAVCSDLLDSCIVNLEQFILVKSRQNTRFHEMYAIKFREFEANVRRSRDDHKTYLDQNTGSQQKILLQNGKSHSLTISTDSDPKSQRGDKSQNSLKDTQIKSGLTKSSDEAKESDLKTPRSLSNKSKNRGLKVRRRRKRIQKSTASSSDSETDFNTDSSSDEDAVSDISSNFESDYSDVEGERRGYRYGGGSDSDTGFKLPKFSDNDDFVIEEEKIIYPEETKTNLDNLSQLNINGTLSFKSDIDENELIPKIKDHSPNDVKVKCEEPPEKLKYKNMYTKTDPDIILDFASQEITMRSLKILFDWLRVNDDILLGCYHSNPEFVHKIMKLLNYCNIDIFTRKIYFDREFIKTPNVREDLENLFNIRSSIPLSEDITLRNFDLLQSLQASLDWEIPIRENVTSTEEDVMRIFKMVDFGFFICKMKKFKYNFCPRNRRFLENTKRKRDRKSKRRDRRTKVNRKKENKPRAFNERRNGSCNNYNTSNEEKESVDDVNVIAPAPGLRKGYLKNRNQRSGGFVHSSSGVEEEKSEIKKPLPQKCEIMGKLWLKNEVETLEEKLKSNPMNVILTPYVVVDSKALTEFTATVKNLVKSRKFIVLIPNAVLGDLDELKKNNNGARNAIRWLEQEFKKGNRFLRSQRDNENLTLTLIKVPRKLDREASVFLKIAQFCNYIVSNHADGTGIEMNIMTFLSGDNLNEKRHTNFSYTGILDAIPVRYDQIFNYYSKYKSK